MDRMKDLLMMREDGKIGLTMQKCGMNTLVNDDRKPNDTLICNTRKKEMFND
jgi:hypothetical protein